MHNIILTSQILHTRYISCTVLGYMYTEHTYICKYEKVPIRETNIDSLKILGNVFQGHMGMNMYNSATSALQQ